MACWLNFVRSECCIMQGNACVSEPRRVNFRSYETFTTLPPQVWQHMKLRNDGKMPGEQPVVKPQAQTESVNLDTTALVALCSDLVHGRSAGTDPLLLPQEKEEKESPFLQSAGTWIGGGLLVTETVRREFVHIIEKLAGNTERARAQELLQRVTIVADKPSDRVSALKSTAQIKPRHIAIFGTGDRLGVPTVTANQTFVRSAAEQGVELCVIFHQPRSLSEVRADKSRTQL